jgi:hypothetical protein
LFAFVDRHGDFEITIDDRLLTLFILLNSYMNLRWCVMIGPLCVMADLAENLMTGLNSLLDIVIRQKRIAVDAPQ